MSRRLSLYFLLLSLPFNGVWMKCIDAAPKAPDPAASSANSEIVADCERICALAHHSGGAICLALAGNPGASIIVVAFGAPVLPATIGLSAPAPTDQRVSDFQKLPLDPALSRTVPPPEI